jgi:hypothetical protein
LAKTCSLDGGNLVTTDFKGLNVVVTDCRSDTEADRFRELGGYIVKIVRGCWLDRPYRELIGVSEG